MVNLVVEAQYFPSIHFFSAIKNSKTIFLNDKELFQKQSYRSRCSILGANGVLDLIAQIDHNSPRKMSKIGLNYTDRWVEIHLKSIESAYRRSPYYDYFSDQLFAPLLQKPAGLLELNEAIIKRVLKILDLEIEIKRYSLLESTSEFQNIADEIHPKKLSLLQDNKPYTQVFGEKFVPHLSILDLIFCEGKEAIFYL